MGRDIEMLKYIAFYSLLLLNVNNLPANTLREVYTPKMPPMVQYKHTRHLITWLLSTQNCLNKSFHSLDTTSSEKRFADFIAFRESIEYFCELSKTRAMHLASESILFCLAK